MTALVAPRATTAGRLLVTADKQRGRGRPSLYTPDLAERICEQLAAPESLKAVAQPELEHQSEG